VRPRKRTTGKIVHRRILKCGFLSQGRLNDSSYEPRHWLPDFLSSASESHRAGAGGDEEGLPVAAAEADRSRRGLRDRDLLDAFAGLVEDRDSAAARQVDIAFVVDRHVRRSLAAKSRLLASVPSLWMS